MILYHEKWSIQIFIISQIMKNTNEVIEVAVDHRCLLGEGPIWDSVNSRILWVDIENGEIHQFFTKDKIHKVFKVGQMIGAISLSTSGLLVAALQHGFFRINLETEIMYPILDPEAAFSENRFNDGKCDPAGRFWAGTMSVKNEANAGKLYMLVENLTVSVKINEVTCSNGLAWSLDHKTFYYIDTGTQQVVAYDYDITTATIKNKRSIIKIAAEEGYPDGMTIDNEGMLWVALWGGGKLKRYNPNTGELLHQIELPASQVTSCTFGGENLEDLYITTAKTGLDKFQQLAQPLAGSLFVIRKCGYRGVPSFLYAG